jgi:hypothetical protein
MLSCNGFFLGGGINPKNKVYAVECTCDMYNNRYRIPYGLLRRDNLEKLVTFGTQNTRGRQAKQINTTRYVLDTTIPTQTQITRV